MLISSAIGSASPPDAGTNAKKKVVVGKKGQCARQRNIAQDRWREGEGTDGDDEDDYDVNVDAEERGMTRNP